MKIDDITLRNFPSMTFIFYFENEVKLHKNRSLEESKEGWRGLLRILEVKGRLEKMSDGKQWENI